MYSIKFFCITNILLSFVNAYSPNCPIIYNFHSIYIPHKTDCTKFFQCSNGQPYIFTCPAGLHFNPKLNICDWPYRAGCNATSISTSTEMIFTEKISVTTIKSAKNITTKSTPPLNSTISVNVSVSSITENKVTQSTKKSSENTTMRIKSTTNSESITSAITKSMKSSSKSIPSTTSPSITIKVSFTTKAPPIEDLLKGRKCRFYNIFSASHPYDCRKYIRCFFGKLEIKVCPLDYHFNARQSECKPQELANCKV